MIRLFDRLVQRLNDLSVANQQCPQDGNGDVVNQPLVAAKRRNQSQMARRVVSERDERGSGPPAAPGRRRGTGPLLELQQCRDERIRELRRWVATSRYARPFERRRPD